ncbi:MAG: hypothetical protein A2722_04335 [Candidatus Doudnabacteria bacterium RIFCSPHIGHO2_01_FULL_50_11]|uniref:Uncharacterized protein n=1 Tax=Candidatus Doudnabacteria bacterium RIFCSPHIGHO2_01_FULL_50_11 TaxID=1817828 RepID=A0A1F5PG65_9BACT|nr:MAG: hypothetical protein A2722_04335 [Candidatus Doudnabacteria bacterium RIFCSPHIGHO2_01_FULL_50_11]HLC44793.1 hypothetical protein [Patescibacteria group bacterium]
MEIDFGEHDVTAADEHAEIGLRHMKHRMSREERQQLFRETKRDGRAIFSEKGKKYVLKRTDRGDYTIERE